MVRLISSVGHAFNRELRPEEWDGLLLTGVFLISAAPYLFGLGFYSDDYAFLAIQVHAPDQSYWGAAMELMPSPNLAPRPIQPLYLAALYKAFGLSPLPGHVLNHLYLLIGALFFYLALRVLRLSRFYSLSLALIYVTLPHYASDRFWYATYNIVLSMMFFFLSFYCSARFSRGPAAKAWPWLGAASVFMVLSLMSYEIFLVPFVLIPFAACVTRGVQFTPSPRLHPHFFGRLRLALLHLAVTVALVVPVLMWKARIYGAYRVWQGTFGDWLASMHWLYKGALKFNFWEYGLELPVNIAYMLEGFLRLEAVGAALVAFAIVWMGLSRLYHPHRDRIGGWAAAGTAVLGLAVTLGSYVVFANNFNIGFSSTGLANRVHIASSVGVAFIALACAVAAGGMALRRFHHVAVPVLVAAGCATGVLITAHLGMLWTEAYRAQQTVLAKLYADMPKPPPGTAVLIDRICPFVGPGPVFESAWDLKGVLQIHFDDPTLQADVIKPSIAIGETGLRTILYGTLKMDYAYGHIVVYNVAERRVRLLDSAAAARAYFARFDPADANGCTFMDGGGVTVFRPVHTQTDAQGS